MRFQSQRFWIPTLVIAVIITCFLLLRLSLERTARTPTELAVPVVDVSVPQAISGDTLLRLIETQMSYGPRYIGSSGHDALRTMLKTDLEEVADEVIVQSWEHKNNDGSVDVLENIVAQFNPEAPERILLAAHYDTRRFADRDTEYPRNPVPGANDGASGVAVLLGLARVFSESLEENGLGVDLVFFDGEEGEIVGNDVPWVPLGSTHFSSTLNELYTPETLPLSGVVIDMVCEHDISLPIERSSLQQATTQTQHLWRVGHALYPEIFIDTVRGSIGDDHTPLNAAGIPTVLVIDLEYPEWHTVSDTSERCSNASLEAVAHTILTYVYDIGQSSKNDTDLQ